MTHEDPNLPNDPAASPWGAPQDERRPDTAFSPTGAADNPGPHRRRTMLWVALPILALIVASVALIGRHGEAQRQGEATGAATAAGNPPTNAGPGAPWGATTPAHPAPGVYPSSNLPNQPPLPQPAQPTQR
jgi:hypothetical protein